MDAEKMKTGFALLRIDSAKLVKNPRSLKGSPESQIRFGCGPERNETSVGIQKVHAAPLFWCMKYGW
jgi:hypothetical protein